METKENKATVNVSKKPATKKKSGFKGIKAAGLVIIICFVIALLIYNFILGAPSHFAGGNSSNSPVDLAGTVYKGGVIVPLIHTLLLTVIALGIERYLAIKTAFGKASLYKFVQATRAALEKKDLAGVQAVCDKQGGTVANVVSATLAKYKEVDQDTVLTKEQKILAIQKELDEATALEMPTLQQNLVIIATITTLGVLFGLMGTVFGMIRSFQALSAGGGADSAALSQGISEALVNTFFGIVTSATAVILYNYFTNKIDKLTYSLDEVGFTIVQTFSATH
jgi:biopolymer transport protein ExbB